MNDKKTTTGRADAIWQISTFKLENVSSSDRIYVNGLQQIKLKIELAFTDLTTGKPGVLTPAELASLTVAFADEGTPLPADDGVNTQWVTSKGVPGSGDVTYDKGYLPYPGGSQQAGDGDPSPHASTFAYFYIACNGLPAQSVKLCAYVRCSDGWIYRTNGTNSDPEGGEYSGKDSTVKVQGMVQEVGAIEQYRWTRDVLSGDDNGIDAGGKVTNPDSVHRYSISFVDKGGNEVGLRLLTVEPAGMIQWHDKVAGEHRACYTGWAPPGSTDLQWNSEVPTGVTPKPTLPSADTRKGVIVLVGRQNIPYTDGKPNGPCKLSTTDAYGNTNTFSVKFATVTGEGRWKLILSR